MNVMVTGGGGVIGSALIKELRNRDHTPYSIDIDSETYNIKEAEVSWNYDINLPGMVTCLCRNHHIDAIVHLAEVNSIDPLLWVQAMKTNVGGTAEVLNACATLNMRGAVGTWELPSPIVGPLAHSLEWRRAMIYLYSIGLTVVNEVTIPHVLHPDLPASSYGAIVNRVHNLCELHQHIVIDPCEQFNEPMLFCRVRHVVDGIIETLQHKTRKPLQITGSWHLTRNRASLSNIIGLALGIFDMDSATVYSKCEPITVSALNPTSHIRPKTLYNLRHWIKEEWYEHLR